MRRHCGFTLEAKEDYLTQTKSLIEKLLIEKTS